MLVVNSTRSIISLSKGEKTGLVLGLGTSEDIQEAIKKAIFDCVLINTVATLYGKVPSLNLDDFVRFSSHESKHHRQLHLKNKVLIQNHDWMWESDNEPIKNKTLNLDSFKYIEMKPKDALLKDVPLVAIQCLNPDLQKSFYGPFNDKHINMNRLHRFLNDPVGLFPININKCLHPLG